MLTRYASAKNTGQPRGTMKGASSQGIATFSIRACPLPKAISGVHSGQSSHLEDLGTGSSVWGFCVNFGGIRPGFCRRERGDLQETYCKSRAILARLE